MEVVVTEVVVRAEEGWEVVEKEEVAMVVEVTGAAHLLEHFEGTLVLGALRPLLLRFCRVAGARGRRLCLAADRFHDWEPGQHVCWG